MKKIFTVLFAFFLVFGLVSFKPISVSAELIGSSCDNPIILETPGNLLSIGDNLSACYILANDIDMLNVEWTPIGDYNTPFTGVLNGDGHSILNLSSETRLVTYSYTNAYTMALFGVMADEAIVENLGLNIDYVLDSTVDSANGQIVVGGLVGMVEDPYVVIHDVWVSGSIDVQASDPVNFQFASVGGLAGEVVNNVNYIHYISYTGDIHVDISSVIEIAVGGIVGYAENSSVYGSKLFDSSIIIETEPLDRGYIGGIVGDLFVDSDALEYLEEPAISASVVSDVNFETLGSNMVGGLVGEIIDDSDYYSKIEENLVVDCTFEDGSDYIGGLAGNSDDTDFYQNEVRNISMGSEGQTAQMGGLVGYSVGSSFDENKITGLVITAGEDSMEIGGITGYMDGGYIDLVYVEGTLSSQAGSVGGMVGYAPSGADISNSAFDGSLSGKYYVGGLIGDVYEYETYIWDCWVKGSISSSVNIAGGLIGMSEYTDLSIGDSYVLANVSGPQYIGGLIGETYVGAVTIDTVYFAGEVSGDFDYDAIIGFDNADDTSENLIYYSNINESNYGIAVNPADFKSATSVVGLAFDAQDQTTDTDYDTPWFVNTMVNDGYLGVFADRDIIRLYDQEELVDIQMTWGQIYSSVDTDITNKNVEDEIFWSSRASKPSDPTRTGYVFEGWFEYLGEVDENEWDFVEYKYSDVTLSAKWSIKKDFTTDIVTNLDDDPVVDIPNDVLDFTNDLENEETIIMEIDINFVEVIDVYKEDVAIINAYIAGLSNHAGVGVIYLDLKLFKILNGPSITQIDDTLEPITISIKVPEKFRDMTDFTIIRIHDGVVSDLKATYDPETFMLTFTTDKFSTFGIQYTNDSIPDTGASANTNLILMFMGLGLFLLSRKSIKLA